MISLFAGIGLMDLGLERAGLGSPETLVEIDPYCRQVLARHWRGATIHDDVKTFAAPPARIVAGGFPCQPYSVAGGRRGSADERALWPHFARIVSEARPAIVIAENVPGLRTLALRGVLADLAALGFDAEWHCFSAGSIGAPHKRDRLWIAATHPDRCELRELPGWLGRSIRAAQAAQSRRDREVLDPDTASGRRAAERSGSAASGWTEPRRGGAALVADSDGEGRVQRAIRVATERGWAEYCGWHLGEPARVDDGRPSRLERSVAMRRRRALGNGVVVACAELVGRAVVGATSRAPAAEGRDR